MSVETASNKTEVSYALESLICAMLRGPHISTLGADELKAFVAKAGVSLHNLPHLMTGEELQLRQLQEINQLDPGGSRLNRGGPWATHFARSCGFDLTDAVVES